MRKNNKKRKWSWYLKMVLMKLQFSSINLAQVAWASSVMSTMYTLLRFLQGYINSTQKILSKSAKSTMVQKLSKCEVKVWLCWHLMILPPVRFSVKPNFVKFKWSKNVILGNFRDSELWMFGKFGTWKLLKFTKNKNSEPLKLQKITFWTILIRQNWISHKF